jgi:hypothetical protein
LYQESHERTLDLRVHVSGLCGYNVVDESAARRPFNVQRWHKLAAKYAALTVQLSYP